MRKQVLIVEDNALNREILFEILSTQYRVLQAENGQEALDLLQAHGDDVALILLDVMMPVMDGYAFLDRIRTDHVLSRIPVIVTTQSDSEEDEIIALSHGATDYVPKPYRPRAILHRAASLIKLRETSAMVDQFMHDSLTGLYSREYFFTKVRDTLAEHPDTQYTLVCSNIENFKLFNDTYGTAEGDRLLREGADITRKMLGNAGFAGRFAADRFLSLVRREVEILDREHFGHFNFEISPFMRNVVMRWGIYEITDRSVPIEQMCDRAMLAANSIKGQYNRHFATYDDELRSKLLREQAITHSMESALAEGQFAVYLQPKYSLTGECLTGAEALVRWVHPTLGFLSPGEFIPLFEKNGFISRLDQYVWEQVCALLRSWQDRGLPPLPVSVNISRADVLRMDLTATLRELITTYGIDPACLHLEITESAYAESSGPIISAVDELRALGFVVEMDDFGSGYSSLNTFSRMRLDVLKLDMRFIQSEIAKPAGQSLLGDIVTMAHRLSLSVVAEGIETREQVLRLQAIGCAYAQGYYFSRPLPVDEFERLRSEQRIADAQSIAASRRGADPSSLLVVDADPDYRCRVHNLFAEQYHILEAATAGEALAHISAEGSEGICVVIVSTALPDRGAMRIMDTLRRNPHYWEISVLATMDGSDAPKDELTMAMAADDFLCKCHPLPDLRRRVTRLMDAAGFRARESALIDEASRDPLTGLLNRRGLQKAILSLHRDDLPVTLCLFDLDNLKAVNDSCGHGAGDRMILAFASLLRANTRSGDILCRYGGDEFIVVLKRLADAQVVLEKGEQICRALQESLKGEPFTASCSGGVALCPAKDRPGVWLIERADRALYCAKRQQKGRCMLWDEGMEIPEHEE